MLIEFVLICIVTESMFCLSDMEQVVDISGMLSKQWDIIVEVAQGSMVGPL